MCICRGIGAKTKVGSRDLACGILFFFSLSRQKRNRKLIAVLTKSGYLLIPLENGITFSCLKFDSAKTSMNCKNSRASHSIKWKGRKLQKESQLISSCKLVPKRDDLKQWRKARERVVQKNGILKRAESSL